MTRAVHRLLVACRRANLPEILAGVIALWTVAWGLTLVLLPKNYPDTTFHETFTLVSPLGWAIGMFGGALYFVWVLVVDRRSAQWPAFAMAVLYSFWGFLTWKQVDDGGLPPLSSTVLAFLYALVGLIYYGESHDGDNP